MPAHVREEFRGILASRGPTGNGARDPERERKVDAAAQWMHESGTPLGFQTPNAGERARAFGMGQYLGSLGLSEQDLFDATGNMLDEDALLVRVRCPIKGWFNRGPVPARVTPTPTQIGVEYIRGAAQLVHRPQRERNRGSRRCRQTCRASSAKWRAGTSARTPSTGVGPVPP